MNMPHFARLLAFAFLVATASAQTFVVDASNGPGTDFTSLPTAIATVPDGSTLLLRAGTYASTTVTKGLTILGESAPTVNPLFFSNLTAAQPVTIKGIRPVWLRFTACQGRVHVENCTAPPASFSLVVDQCPQVSVVGCTFPSGPLFKNSDVVCVRCTVPPGQGSWGFSIEGGRTQLARCNVSSVLVIQPPIVAYQPAITMNGGDLRLLGPGTVAGSPGVAAISGSGVVRAGANVTLSGTSIPYSVIDEGSTSSTAAPLGGVVTGTLEGSASLFGGLLFGFPQPPQLLAGIAEELWVNPIGFAISGSLGAPLTFWLDVPNDPFLRGWVLGWQGVTLGSAGTVLTNPAWFCMQ